MKTLANGAALLTLLCSVFVSYGQELVLTNTTSAKDAELSRLLRPSDYAIARAKELGGSVFKLLPMEGASGRGTSLGVYYSFKESNYASHQISVLRNELNVGGGWSYGFYADLGEKRFRDIDGRLPEASYFLSYRPPKLDPDIRNEIERLEDTNINGVRLVRRVKARLGHTYLLRSIDFENADTAIVLHILELSTDGSITIVWKKLFEFPTPISLFMPDEEMQNKVDATLAELKMRGLRVRITDNMLIPIGVDVDQEFGRFKEALREQGVRYRGISFSMIKRTPNRIPN